MNHDYHAVAPKVEEALRKLTGGNAAIDLSEGYEGRVRVKIVSPFFNGMPESVKGNLVWDAINSEIGSFNGSISFVVAYGTDEL